jgi:hypothetical protein
MSPVEFEPTIPVYGRAKTVHALDRVNTVIGRIITCWTNLHFWLKIQRKICNFMHLPCAQIWYQKMELIKNLIFVLVISTLLISVNIYNYTYNLCPTRCIDFTDNFLQPLVRIIDVSPANIMVCLYSSLRIVTETVILLYIRVFTEQCLVSLKLPSCSCRCGADTPVACIITAKSMLSYLIIAKAHTDLSHVWTKICILLTTLLLYARGNITSQGWLY